MSKVIWFSFFVSVAMLCGGLFGSLYSQADDLPYINTTTQSYSPARFALFAAEINVAAQQFINDNHTQKVLARIDTQTGEIAILQLQISGINNPTVRSAFWCPVPENAQFSPDRMTIGNQPDNDQDDDNF